MVLTLDYKSRLPIYEQLYRAITHMAAIGAIAPNEQLPSVRALAEELGVNPNTVQKAYQMLEHDEIIFSLPGKGSFLSSTNFAIEQERSRAIQALKKSVLNALDCGVAKDVILHAVETCCSEKGDSL